MTDVDFERARAEFHLRLEALMARFAIHEELLEEILAEEDARRRIEQTENAA